MVCWLRLVLGFLILTDMHCSSHTHTFSKDSFSKNLETDLIPDCINYPPVVLQSVSQRASGELQKEVG